MSNLILIIPIVSLFVLFTVLHFRYKYKLKNLTDSLDQEHQKNINLDRNLAQTRQKAEDLSNELKEIKANSHQITEPREEHLSRQNERLSRELDQERRRNADIKTKLAVSNSSLDKSCQRNEQLTNNLKQERKDKAKLERQLVNLNRSAYQTILEAIYLENSARTDDQKRRCLEKLREASISLGKEYQQQEISPDYSKQDYQEAYLLRYFLPYSQPVPYLLNHLILKKDFSYQLPDNGLLTASFFGCGPGPEIFGLMRYLGSYQPSIRISAAMLDREPWKHGRKIVRQLLDRTWNSDLYNTQEFKADIVGSPSDFLPVDSEEWVKRSDLIVFQHCLNERYNARSNQLIENMTQLVAKMKTGAVMLIIERARYPVVKELLGQFCYELKRKFGDSLEIEREIMRRDGVEIKPILDVIPKTLATYFFTENSVHSVNSVKFIWVALAKK